MSNFKPIFHTLSNIPSALSVLLYIILVMSYRIIKRLVEKSTLENIQTMELYGENGKRIATALTWLMIAFINGTVITFMGIIYLPESFALIAILTIGKFFNKSKDMMNKEHFLQL